MIFIYMLWLVSAMVARGPPETEVEDSSPLLVVSLSFSSIALAIQVVSFFLFHCIEFSFFVIPRRGSLAHWQRGV